MKRISKTKIRFQIKYLYDHNPTMPIEAILVALCEAIAQAQLEACEKEATERVREILDSLINENGRLSVELQKDRIERPIDYEGYKVLRSKKKSIQFAISIVKKHLGGE